MQSEAREADPGPSSGSLCRFGKEKDVVITMAAVVLGICTRKLFLSEFQQLISIFVDHPNRSQRSSNECDETFSRRKF